MDFFKVGLRNLLGIVLPGALLLLILFYVLFTAATSLGVHLQSGPWMEDRALSLIVLFIISYLLGNLMRLNSAEDVDKKSAKYNQKKHSKRVLSPEECKEELKKAWEALRPNPRTVGIPTVPIGVWEHEKFPYPVWQFWKLRLYHPEEMYKFFWTYRDCMRGGYDRGSGKEFFNYCKAVVHHASGKLGDALVLEIQSAEALVRFFAGTYYALVIGQYMLAILFLLQVVAARGELELNILSLGTVNICATALLMIAMYKMQRMIVERFRTLRIKEVDTVYDAFYLVHRHPDFCPACSTQPPQQIPEEYIKREELLREAFCRGKNQPDGRSAVSLDCLVSLMKERSRECDFLSSIYFAGAEGDHPYFLKNKNIAVGIAVLPEDSAKAGASKKHPEQKEIIFVLNGTLLLEVEENGRSVPKTLTAGTATVIEKGQCHRISPIDNQDATYLFAKTNPAIEPRQAHCEL